jgi:hypothetical protein
MTRGVFAMDLGNKVRRHFTAKRVERSNAGGTLYAPVDQHGIESGDTPSYGRNVIQRRCDQLNAIPNK